VIDRWAEINLECFDSKDISGSVSRFVRDSLPYFGDENKGVSLIVEFHGDNIHMWNGAIDAEMPTTMAKGWSYRKLKELVDSLHSHGFEVAHSHQANYYEYIPSQWINDYHPELGKGIMSFIDITKPLRKDTLRYAEFDNVEGIPYYKFFAKQWRSFNDEIGFDYIFLRDGWLGKSWRRSFRNFREIRYKTDIYIKIFKEISKNGKIITWSTGMSANPFHDGIDIEKILPYVKIYMTQSYSTAWQDFWMKFQSITGYEGGYTPHIFTTLINRELTAKHGVKHYIILNAWDWEGWNAITHIGERLNL